MPASSHSRLPGLADRTVAIITWILAVYFNIKYAFGRHSHLDNHHSFHVGNTPFTANVFFVIAYWLLTYLLQLLFLVQFYKPESVYVGEHAAIGYHFSLFNLLQVVWSWFFARGHWVLAEITLILNFFNLMALYVAHKPYAIRPLSRWFFVHVPTTAIPVAWIIYAIFWNGAIAVHAHGLFGRIVANILVWDFLIIPGVFLVLYRDWAVGLAFSYLTTGLAVGQFFTKVIALQWIFALIIAPIVFVASIYTATVPATQVEVVAVADAERGETAPLLSDGN
jgi:hypothetical protein